MPAENVTPEVKQEEKKTEKVKEAPEPKKEKQPVPQTNAEKIVAFLADKTDFTKLNDFLKSLYPVPRHNEPAIYLNLPDNKQLRNLLESMQAEGKIEIRNNAHRRLAERFYDENQVQRFHNLNTILIEAKNI